MSKGNSHFPFPYTSAGWGLVRAKMNVPKLSTNLQYSYKNLMINMTIWMRNHIVNLCNAVSAPAAVVTLWVRWKKPVKSVITLDH